MVLLLPPSVLLWKLFFINCSAVRTVFPITGLRTMQHALHALHNHQCKKYHIPMHAATASAGLCITNC